LVHYVFLYKVAIDLKVENLVVNDPTEKSTLGCGRTLSEANRSGTLEHLHHSSELWRHIHIPLLLLSAKNLTPSWARSKAAFLFEEIYVACINILIIL